MNTQDKVNEEGAQLRPEKSASSVSRRLFVGAAALAGAGFVSATALGQNRSEQHAGRTLPSSSDPGPENQALLKENPNSNTPPFTDHGNLGPIWFSFDLAPKRMQGGGWTHQVTQRELPPSKDLAGVNMRLTAGSFRELHWHTADEWAIMLTGKARISVMQPDGKMFIDDIGPGDLWYFPAGFPHSIQGLEGDGCEFLLVFDEGSFSEDDTFLLSEFLAHTPPEVVQKNMGWSREIFDQLPATELYIFEAPLPGPLADDRRFLGDNLERENKYTFKTSSMPATKSTPGGEVRIIDSTNFPVALNIAAAVVTLKPGAIREMHWHPNVSEWQYWIKGKGRMTVVTTEAKARTMDFNANDVGFVPAMAGHSIENTGTEDIVFLEMFKTARYQDVFAEPMDRPDAGQNGESASQTCGFYDSKCSSGQGDHPEGIAFRPRTLVDGNALELCLRPKSQLLVGIAPKSFGPHPDLRMHRYLWACAFVCCADRIHATSYSAVAMRSGLAGWSWSDHNRSIIRANSRRGEPLRFSAPRVSRQL